MKIVGCAKMLLVLLHTNIVGPFMYRRFYMKILVEERIVRLRRP